MHIILSASQVDKAVRSSRTRFWVFPRLSDRAASFLPLRCSIIALMPPPISEQFVSLWCGSPHQK